MNNARRSVAEKDAELAKRCRTLIKQWQKIVEFRSTSSSGSNSNSCTPNLQSPNDTLRKNITPSPSRSRIASNGTSFIEHFCSFLIPSNIEP